MQKRFKCNSCFRNCETTFSVLDGGEGTNPTRCIVDPDVVCAWTPIGESKPPKLTQEIFETDECPAWAEYAAVDAYGTARFYSSEPVADLFTGAWYLPIEAAQAKPYRGNKFDADTWTNSLMKRESKKPELPDWVYNAEYGYHQDHGYVRLDEILEEDTKITIMATGVTRYVWNDAFSRIVEARKRPFNDKEMQSLIGKTFETSHYNFLITGYNRKTNYVKVNEMWFNAEELMNGKTSMNPPLIDGKPCYVLEHLNKNGEWVK